MRQFITAKKFNMTVLSGSCAGEMSAVERRLWPYFELIKEEKQVEARKRNNG